MRSSVPERRLTRLALAIIVLSVIGVSACGGGGPGAGSGADPAADPTADPIAGLGQTWTVLDAQAAGLGDANAVHLAAVVDGPPGYVAVGGVSRPDGGGTVAAVWTSPDGRSWQRVAHDDEVFGTAEQPPSAAGTAGFTAMTDVTVAHGQLVAVGVSENPAGHLQPAAWISDDGHHWTRSAELGGPQPGDLQLLAVSGHDQGLVAVGSWRPGLADESSVAVAASSDGRSWRLVPIEETIEGFRASPWQQMSAVVAGGPGLVAVGCADRPEPGVSVQDAAGEGWVAAVWTSTDEATWRRVPHDEAVFGGPGAPWMRGVAVGGPGLVAVGSVSAGFDEPGPRTIPAVWTSPDGLAWTRIPAPELSADGEVELLDVAQTRAGLIAVGSVDVGGPDVGEVLQAAAWRSEDGERWTRVGPPTPAPDQTAPDQAAPDHTAPDHTAPDPADPTDRDRGHDVEWAALTAVTDGPHGLVAVGFVGTSSDTARAVVWTSP